LRDSRRHDLAERKRADCCGEGGGGREKADKERDKKRYSLRPAGTRATRSR